MSGDNQQSAISQPGAKFGSDKPRFVLRGWSGAGFHESMKRSHSTRRTAAEGWRPKRHRISLIRAENNVLRTLQAGMHLGGA